MQFKAWTLFLPIIFMTGCMSNVVDVEPTLDFKPPKYVEELPSKELDDDMPRMGSLFGTGDRPLFTDRKAMHVNDIIMVRISENTSASTKANKKLSQNNVTNLGGGKIGFTGTKGHASKRMQGLNDLANYTYDSTSNTAYQGQGQVSRNEKFDTTVTARIIKVMNNGNYFIYGKREMLISGEKHIIKVSGVISPYDISQNNEIASSKMGDAKIAYLTQGDVRTSTRQGKATRAAEALWPF